jgi:hypothetical protein
MSIEDGLGFRVKDTLVDLLVDKERKKARFTKVQAPGG